MGAETSYSIDEVAAAVGMTARNVRAYTTKGLLPPPIRTGRASRYRTTHLQRLHRIRELRDAGIPLKLIERAVQQGDDLGPASPLRGLHPPGPGRAGRSTPRAGAAVVIDLTGHPVRHQLLRAGLHDGLVEQLAATVAHRAEALARDLEHLVVGEAPLLAGRVRADLADLASVITGEVMRRRLTVGD